MLDDVVEVCDLDINSIKVFFDVFCEVFSVIIFYFMGVN